MFKFKKYNENLILNKYWEFLKNKEFKNFNLLLNLFNIK